MPYAPESPSLKFREEHAVRQENSSCRFADAVVQHDAGTVSLHTGRLSFTNIDADTMVRCVEELEQESRKLADAEVGVIVLAATAPSVTGGKDYDRELIKRMEDASGKPATTASTAFIEAMTVLGIRRIAMAAPWTEATNKTVVSFLEANGFKVVHHEVMGLVRNTDLGRVDPESAWRVGQIGRKRMPSYCRVAIGRR